MALVLFAAFDVKYPDAQVSRIAGADLWEAFSRSVPGKKAHRSFWLVANLRYWRRRKVN